jgi:hypothetical protein
MSRQSGWVGIVGAVAMAAAGCSGGDAPRTTGSTAGPVGSPTPVVTRSVAAVGEVATCQPGSQPDRPGPAEQPRPMLNGETGVSAALDAQSGVVVVIDDIRATWTFDVCTNTWDKPATTGSSPPQGARLVYDAASDLTYAFGDAEVVAFDVESAVWTLVNTGQTDLDGASAQHRVLLDADSRTVYVYNTGNGELNSYDLARNRWAVEVDQGTKRPPVGVDGLAAFDASVGRIVLKVLYHVQGSVTAMGEPVSTPPVPVYGQTWTFDPATGTWAKVDTTTPELLFGYFPWGGEMTYDTTTRVSVVFSEGMLAMFDATTGEWATATVGSGWPPATPWADPPDAVASQPDGTELLIPVTAGRLARTGHAVVDDVVNDRLLVLGGRVRDAADQPQKGSDAWAYHVASNTWTMVVPAQPD